MGASHRMAAGVLVIQPTTGFILTFYAVNRPGGALPCGKVDPGETPEEAAVREAFEETGYRVSLLPDAPFIATLSDNFTVFTYKAVLVDGVPETPTHAFEGRAKWMPYTELLSGPYPEYNRGVLEWFGLLRS